MSFEAKQTQEENFEIYKQLKRQASQSISQMRAWEDQFQALRASVDTEKQGELDARKVQLGNQLRNILGL